MAFHLGYFVAGLFSEDVVLGNFTFLPRVTLCAGLLFWKFDPLGGPLEVP